MTASTVPTGSLGVVPTGVLATARDAGTVAAVVVWFPLGGVDTPCRQLRRWVAGHAEQVRDLSVVRCSFHGNPVRVAELGDYLAAPR